MKQRACFILSESVCSPQAQRKKVWGGGSEAALNKKSIPMTGGVSGLPIVRNDFGVEGGGGVPACLFLVRRVVLYGNRQALDFASAGPSTHVFEF